jgi:hypothetical protein
VFAALALREALASFAVLALVRQADQPSLSDPV